MANNTSASTFPAVSAVFSVAARLLDLPEELKSLIAAAVVEVSDSPAAAMTDVKNLRLTSKAWDETVEKSPTVQQLLFNKPIPEYRVRRLTKPENGLSPANLLQVSGHYSERGLVSPSKVTFNPIMRHLLLRFRALLGCKPRGTDTVNVTLGQGKNWTSFWMSYSNRRGDPRVDPMDNYTIEVDLWRKFGLDVCRQYVCQPPIKQIGVKFLSETDAFSYGCPKGSTTLVCEGGVQIGHVLSVLLACLNENGEREMDELLYGPKTEETQTTGWDEVDQGNLNGDEEEEEVDATSICEDDEDEVQVICDGEEDPDQIIWEDEEEDEDTPVWEDEAGDAIG